MVDETSEPDDPAPNAGAEIPEIEAEIVEEGAPSAHEGAFTDRETSANPADVEVEPNKPAPKRMPFTPGVILFFVFAAFALLVFAVWRLQGPGNAPVAEIQQQQGDEEAPSIDGVPEQVDAPENNQIEDPAPDFAGNVIDDAEEDVEDDVAGADTDNAAAALADVDQGKIENSQFAELENTKGDLNPLTNVAPGSDVFLPPLGSNDAAKGGNQALQRAAKDAYHTLDSATASPLPGGDDEEATPSANEPPAFEIEDDDAVKVAQNQTDADQPSSKIVTQEGQAVASENTRAAAGAQTPTALSGAEENAKLLNDISALKQSFEAEKMQLTKALEDERQRNANQREEIDALRHDFQAAIAARDETENAELLELRERLSKIRNDEVTPIARRVAGAAALKSLERALDEGGPFVTELDSFEQAAPGAPAIVILRKYAGIGIVPMQNLKDRFDAAASSALTAARKEQANGIGGALIAQAQNIITIRPAKPRPGSEPGAVISRAEYAVENNDLTAAIAELAELSPAGRDAMITWLADAQARLDATSAMGELNNKIFGALSQ